MSRKKLDYTKQNLDPETLQRKLKKQQYNAKFRARQKNNLVKKQNATWYEEGKVTKTNQEMLNAKTLKQYVAGFKKANASLIKSLNRNLENPIKLVAQGEVEDTYSSIEEFKERMEKVFRAQVFKQKANASLFGKIATRANDVVIQEVYDKLDEDTQADIKLEFDASDLDSNGDPIFKGFKWDAAAKWFTNGKYTVELHRASNGDYSSDVMTVTNTQGIDAEFLELAEQERSK